MGYIKTTVHESKHNRFAKKVFEELNKFYEISLEQTAIEGRYKVKDSVFGNNQMFSDAPGTRSWFKEPMTIGDRVVHMSSDWWPRNIPGKHYARTIFNDLRVFVEELTNGDYTIKDEGTEDKHDYWLYKKVNESSETLANNPNIKNTKQSFSTSNTENVNNYPDKVIVDYTAPYESFCWRGSIHLEIDIRKRTLVSDGWHSITRETPLNEFEKQRYLEFFCNVHNIQDFFNERLAHSTPDILMGSHWKSYNCRIQWGEKDKTISVGEPIPYKLPF